jgi:protoporphyrinogen oxidase
LKEIKTDVLIIGAGLAGLSLARHLKREYLIIEKDTRPGGLAKTEKYGDFLFDYTGHLLHLRNEYTRKFIKEHLGTNLQEKNRNSWIFSKGVYTRYPFQKNTYGLPPQIIKEILLGFINRTERSGSSFEDWIYSHFGDGIAKHFMIPYNAKLWTIPPSELTTDWQMGYVPKVTIEEIIDGALFDNADRVGYNASFFYPMKGGIESLVSAIYEKLDKSRLHTDCEAIEVDPDKKTVSTGNGLKISYRNLVTTAPLKFFTGSLGSSPGKIKEYSNMLRYISVYNLNFAIRGEKFRDRDWIYLPEPELACYRIGFPTNFSSFVAPAGYTTVYTEISYSDRKPLEKKGAREKIISDLMKIGLISNMDEIEYEKLFDIDVGYILYDANRNEAVSSIMLYLNDKGIYSIGRFGAWEYSAMEDAILEGKGTAEMLNEIGGR